MAISEVERRKLWVKSGGRCALCKAYLLEGALTYKEVLVGEAAHIVGREKSAKSARGLDTLDETKRDLAENLMLACSSCHTEIDKLLVADLIDKDFLLKRKLEHENEIRHQTSLTRSRRTVIFRMAGDIRGGRMELPRDTAVQAVIRSGGRFPIFPESYDQQSVEIDLRDIDGEVDASPAYYAVAKAKIDRVVELRLHPGVLNGDIQHISLFAIARLPLVVYLGARVDDGVPIDVYQRQRASQSWVWSDDDPGTTFVSNLVRDGSSKDDAVLILNLSGTARVEDLPASLQGVTHFKIVPDAIPAEDLFSHPAVLGRFETAVRSFFTELESSHKHLKRMHLIGAVPLSAAVTIGLILKSKGIRPSVVTYDRTDDGYVQALEV